MESLWIIITLVAALSAGCVTTWLVMRRKISSAVSGENTNKTQDAPSSDAIQLKEQLKSAIDAKEKSLSLKEELEDRISNLEIQLKKKETELQDNTLKFEELTSTISSGTKEETLIEYLKNNLKVKSNEIESKEEEIEELEDEISSIKKKLKSTKSEIEDLNVRITESEKTSRRLEQELHDTEFKLEELRVEDAAKTEALEFVNAVLQAKDADDRDAKVIDEKVSKIEDLIVEHYIPLQRQYFENTDDWIKLIYLITFHWGNLQRKSWLKRKKVIAFIGEFSAGKTSIVNRILSQDEPDCPRLPVSSKATTAISTYISYGEGFSSQFTDAYGNLKNLPPDMFTKVSKDILAKVNVSSLIQYFVMKYKNENLRGLSILDTPGFSSNDEQDKERTLAVINEADALFWVVDANSGEINRTSLKIIADNIQDIPLYIVINKADTKAPEELDRLENHIKETMVRAEITISGYIRFSQKAPLVDIMKVIESLPKARTGLDIARIYYDLKKDLLELETILKNNKKELRELNRVIENREEVITTDIDDMVYLSDRISNIPQLNERWFAKDDYRMDQDEYKELNRLCNDIAESSEQVKECYNEYKEFASQYYKASEELYKKKEQYKSTKNIYTLLAKALRSYDPELYKEVEQEIAENIKTDKRNLSYDISKDELEKADHFYNTGNIEQAKFWYKEAAMHGNRQAQQMCRKLEITF